MRRILWGALLAASALAAPPAQFREHVIATDLPGGYQVAPLDVNRDGKADLIALASRMSELVWYEAPGWRRHVLATGMSQMINLAACGRDGAGYPILVLASGFSNVAARSRGAVSVLECQGDPRRPWKVTEIDRLPTSHRIRCADIDGSGNPVVVNAPLIGADAVKPDYRDHVPLVFYRPGEWERRLIGDQNEGVMHGLHICDWDGDGRDEILTASFSGIHLFDRTPAGRWTRTEIARGDPSPWPNCGASDLAVGHAGGGRFLAAIEPWHGNQVVIYRKGAGVWQRSVIDDSLVDGHTILAADLNGDGVDEIVAGYRGKGRSVYIYYAQDEQADAWKRTVLDNGGIAAAACAVADLNADRRPDIACIGQATANLKWYENLGTR